MARMRTRVQLVLLSLTVMAASALTGGAMLPVRAADEVVAVDSPVTIMGAGDIAVPTSSRMPNALATADLIRAGNPDAVFTTGDNAHPDATLSDYLTAYEPTWGSFKDKTYPVPGNHEYHFVPPAGYLDYFDAAKVTNGTDGGIYYAWDVGNGWRAYAVNTQISTSGAQLTWLQNDVAAHPGMHYLLYAHRPRYTSGVNHSPSTAVCPLWNALAGTGNLEIVLGGHQHNYERFAKMDCAGNASATGSRSFVVGTGGDGMYAFGVPQPGSEFRNATDFGVLKLVLHDSYYVWSYIASGRGWNGSTSVDTANRGAVLDSGSQPTNGSPGGNVAPSVEAGADQSVTLPDSASLDGTVLDDGLPDPPAAVTTTWSKLAGPGEVTFGDASAVDTTASFSAAGSYVLQLSASDSVAAGSDTVEVLVLPAGGGTTGTAEVRLAAGSDDAEQRLDRRTTALRSTDLQLSTDGTKVQVVGTRFAGVSVPAGATVTSAYVQFQVDEVSTGVSQLTIKAEASDNAATYTSAAITGRDVTGSVAWSPPDWTTVGAAGADQRTPNVASLVQAVVSRPGWVPGNAIALQFSGTGRRTAEAFEGSRTGAALLHVEYTVPAPATP